MDTPDRLDGRTLAAIAIALLTWSSAYAAIAYAVNARRTAKPAAVRPT